MKTSRRDRLRAALMITTAFGVLAPLIAFAQDAVPDAALKVAPADEGIVEVVVTASKRETRLLKTPLAVSALTQDSLDKQGIVDVRGLATSVPNLQMGANGDSSTAISLRGVTSTDTTEVAEEAVSIHQDGFYSPRPQGALALMYDVERVEVLRGPQGTLFGMNSPGGVINVIPARPKFGTSFGKIDLGIGNYNERELRATYNFGITDNFAIRANYMMTKHDGYGKQDMDTSDLSWNTVNADGTPDPANNIAADGIPDVDQRFNHRVKPADYYNNADQWAARLIARWQVTENLELTGSVSRFADNGAGDHDYKDCDAAEGTPADCGNHNTRYLNINLPGKIRMTLDEYQFKAAYKISDAMVLEYRGGFEDERRYQLSDIDGGLYAPTAWSSVGQWETGSAADIARYYPLDDSSTETQGSNYRSITQEIQLKSAGDHRLNYVLGLFYLHEHKQIAYRMDWLLNKTYDADSGYLIDGLPYGAFFDQKNRTTESKAIFGQVDYKLTDTLSLTVGGRHSWDSKGDHGGLEYGDWDPIADNFDNPYNYYDNLYVPTGVRAHQSDDLLIGMGTPGKGVPQIPASDPNGADPYITNADMKWSVGTYRLGVQYNPSDKHMFYGSIATGYKMGGVYEYFDFCNNGCWNPLVYGPEHVTNYELGYKGKLLNNRLQLSATLFSADYRDMQSTGDTVVGTNEDPNDPNFGKPVTAWTTSNLTRSRINGLELEFESRPWTNGHLNGYVTWLDAKATEGERDDGYACSEREIFGQSSCYDANGDLNSFSLKGHSLPFAPEFSLSVNYSHDIHLASGWQIEPFVLVHWQSKMWLDVQNYDGAHLSQAQDAYTKIDLNLRLTPPDAKYYVEVYGNNLSDIDTKNFGTSGQGFLRASYDDPRTYGARIGFEF